MDRPFFLDKLISRKNNGMIKVVTGIRRCGKTYLLFELFYRHLIESGVSASHIIKIEMDDIANKELRDPMNLYNYVKAQIKDDEQYYVIIDEVQYVSEFVDVLNGFLHIKNLDTYVTGSNAKFLSKDIITEFRGRGDRVHLYPLSFAEFMSGYKGYEGDAWREYITFGGLPKLLEFDNSVDKQNYLQNICKETYIRDILDRHNVKNSGDLGELFDYLASSIGCLTNPRKLSNTFKSEKGNALHPNTISTYLDYFEDSFLISCAKRYDIKGRRYINTPFKYYFTDLGLRNAELNFRQFEETHLMENAIYNELLLRGYSVDVGVVSSVKKDNNNRRTERQLEVDFVCNKGFERVYIQSALDIPDREKELQEQESIGLIKDSFTKVIITKTPFTHYNNDGVLILNLFDFLLDRYKI